MHLCVFVLCVVYVCMVYVRMVYVCSVYVCMVHYVAMDSHACFPVGSGQRKMLDVFLHCFLSYGLGDRISSRPRISFQLDWLIFQKPLISDPQCYGQQYICSQGRPFVWVLGTWTQVLMLAELGFLPPSHLSHVPSPPRIISSFSILLAHTGWQGSGLVAFAKRQRYNTLTQQVFLWSSPGFYHMRLPGSCLGLLLALHAHIQRYLRLRRKSSSLPLHPLEF